MDKHDRRDRRGSRARGVALLAAVVTVAAGVLLGLPGHRTTVSHALPSAAPVSPSPSVRTTASAAPKASPRSASPGPTRRIAATATARRPAATATRSAGTVRTGHRQVTFVNTLGQTLWIAAAQQTPQPALPTTGWVLRPGRTLTIKVPDHWNGRFWGRTGCVFNAVGRGHCETGDCAGRFLCGQYGVIPATLAEFNFNSWQKLDFYDVSMVDGSNVPLWINIAAGRTKDPVSASGCSSAGCTRPVPCPTALRVRAGGRTVGCESPCGVFDTDQYCCRGTWAPRDQCLPEKWPVDYAAIFKKAQPFAYSYVDDDATSTFTCAGECGYRITFGSSP
ncbi:thaumatin family protein [Streptomyces sp. NPDC059373]